MTTILASDIGGTNSRFAAFNVREDGSLAFLESIWLKTAEASSFENLLAQLEDANFPYSHSNANMLVAAVPGPVSNQTYANLPNVPWAVDISTLKKKVGADKVHLINDFVAQTFACHTPAMKDCILIKSGASIPDMPVSVVGAGTGLGHCTIMPDGHGGYIPLPSEAGHNAFGFVNKEEVDYQHFLTDKLKVPYIIGDIVVSGNGLKYLYEYHHCKTLEPPEIGPKLDKDSIVTQWFARFYGRVCRQYVLSVLPLGGLYLAGGVASKIPCLVDNDIFREEFVVSKAHFDLLNQIQIKLNRNEESGLWGSAFYGLTAMKKTTKSTK